MEWVRFKDLAIPAVLRPPEQSVQRATSRPFGYLKRRMADSRYVWSTLALFSIETGDFSNEQSHTCITTILARKVSKE
jgi:hypothetical protein